MDNKTNMKMSSKHVWLCVGLVALVIAVALGTGSPGLLLFVIPCMLMMGGMMWMMMGGMGGSSRGNGGR